MIRARLSRRHEGNGKRRPRWRACGGAVVLLPWVVPTVLSAIEPKSCNAFSHRLPFPHALIVALKVIVCTSTLLWLIALKSCNAFSHSPPFSHALIAALQEIVLVSISVKILTLRRNLDTCWRDLRTHAGFVAQLRSRFTLNRSETF